MDAASDKLMQELRDIVVAAEELLGAGGSAERLDEIRARAEEALRAARARLEGIEVRLEDQVRRHPLAALGIAAGVGILLGLLLARK